MSEGTFEFPGSKPEKLKEQPTHRFELSLNPSETGYAEFNYLDLVAARIKENGENNEEINEGSSFSSKNTKRLDICRGFNYDKVIGYDTTDSFIDDSELFDEYVEPSPHGFHISCHDDDKNETVRFPDKPYVKKPKIGFVLTTPKKLVKPSRKRRTCSLPSISKKTKKLRCYSACNDDIQIIDEVFKSSISHDKNHVDKTCKVNVSTEMDDEHSLPSNLPEDLKKCLNLLKGSVVKNDKSIKWNDDTKKLLINIEEHLLTCDLKMRSDIYLHLARYLSLSPNTLRKKSKELLVRKLNNHVDDMVIKLAEEIKTLKTCDFSSPREDSRVLEHSVIPKFSSINGSEDCEKNTSESKVQKELTVAKPLQLRNESNFMKKFVTPIIKNILKTIFCCKRKLYEVRKLKTKHFLDELKDYVREDLILMWSPMQKPLQPLLDFASEYFISECHDMKVYKIAKDKFKENLSIQNESVIFVNDNTTGCNFEIKCSVEKRCKGSTSSRKSSSALMNNETESKGNVLSVKKISPISVNGEINYNTKASNLVIKSQNSSKTLNVKTAFTKHQKEGKGIIKAKEKTRKIKKSDHLKTLPLKKNTKPKLSESVKKKLPDNRSSVQLTEATSLPKKIVNTLTKILPISDKASPIGVSNFQNSIMSVSKPSKIETINPEVTTLSNKATTSKSIRSQGNSNIPLGDRTGKCLLVQNINSNQMVETVSNVKFIKAQNITDGTLILRKPIVGTVNQQIDSKNLVLKSGEALKDKVTLCMQKPTLQVSIDGTPQHLTQCKNDISSELKKKDSVPKTIVINIRS